MHGSVLVVNETTWRSRDLWIHEPTARRRAVEFQLANSVLGTNLKQVLKEVEPDVVFDVTVPEAHTEVACTALRHGCHVLGEKPLADSMNKAIDTRYAGVA